MEINQILVPTEASNHLSRLAVKELSTHYWFFPQNTKHKKITRRLERARYRMCSRYDKIQHTDYIYYRKCLSVARQQSKELLASCEHKSGE